MYMVAWNSNYTDYRVRAESDSYVSTSKDALGRHHKNTDIQMYKIQGK
jgi:hypothetical protein